MHCTYLLYSFLFSFFLFSSYFFEIVEYVTDFSYYAKTAKIKCIFNDYYYNGEDREREQESKKAFENWLCYDANRSIIDCIRTETIDPVINNYTLTI